tara:strand:- start:74 stop:448 length:375 start_codon:yes stop_codon:yes gene_type:complete
MVVIIKRFFNMASKRNPLKLNKLQLRTLALAQMIAANPDLSRRDQKNGEVTLLHLPEPHGDHLHIGEFIVSARDASGFSNASVWAALERKGLLRRNNPITATLSPDGLAYETGLVDQVLRPSDH